MLGFKRKPKVVQWFAKALERIAPREDDGPISLRRWDVSKTNRLNQLHWVNANGRTINQDLGDLLETVRSRCTYEATSNPVAEGVINTYVTDVVGDDGPVLQVTSSNPQYNKQLEAAWKRWWKRPDLNGQLAGADVLDLCVRALWPDGEFLVQIVNDEQAPASDPIHVRVLVLAARRLMNPLGNGHDERVTLGVAKDVNGKPLAYYVSSEVDIGFMPDFKTQRLAAKDIIHGFRMLEAGQVRGVPWLATGCQVVADLRDYDAEVLDAARAAADAGVVLKTSHPDATYVPVNESTPIERGQMTTLPPGWDMGQIMSQQPATRYVEYREERERDLGRPVGMPLMIVRLDSRKHNYSSARFDGQVYMRGIAKCRRWLERILLNRLVDLVVAELTRDSEGRRLPKAPNDVEYQWNWRPAPHVDPLKESKAATERLANQTSTLRDECAAHGRDWEDVLIQRAREAELQRDLEPEPATLDSENEEEDDEGLGARGVQRAGGGREARSRGDARRLEEALEPLADAVERLGAIADTFGELAHV